MHSINHIFFTFGFRIALISSELLKEKTDLLRDKKVIFIKMTSNLVRGGFWDGWKSHRRRQCTCHHMHGSKFEPLPNDIGRDWIQTQTCPKVISPWPLTLKRFSLESFFFVILYFIKRMHLSIYKSSYDDRTRMFRPCNSLNQDIYCIYVVTVYVLLGTITLR